MERAFYTLPVMQRELARWFPFVVGLGLMGCQPKPVADPSPTLAGQTGAAAAAAASGMLAGGTLLAGSTGPSAGRLSAPLSGMSGPLSGSSALVAGSSASAASQAAGAGNGTAAQSAAGGAMVANPPGTPTAGSHTGENGIPTSMNKPARETVYVSGYSPDIRVLSLDTASAKLSDKSKISGGMSPSYLAFSPDKRFLYAVNEAGAPADSKVQAFSIDATDGRLTALNSAVTGGTGAPHLAVHPSGRFLAVAHYNSGEVVIIPIGTDGSLGTAGPLNKGPNNSCQNAHQAVFDKTGDHLLVPCLGSNFVMQFKFDAGTLSYNDPATVPVEGGPRHLALSPDEKRAYVLSEHASTITTFKYDAESGKLSEPTTVNSYKQQAGSSAHILVHSSGKFLYASNRQENSLGRFLLDGNGLPQSPVFVTDMIATPRDFSIDPTGSFLLLANQAGAQDVQVFRIDTQSGELTRTQSLALRGSPTFTGALVLP
jgi:6-phosphogluconolactonase